MNERMDGIDRLVDGELAADEYRELLAALDEEPGGWRRCATAFLEAQALAADLHGLALAPCGAASATALAKSDVEQRSNMVMLLAIAASFLLAFGLGIAAPSILHFATQEAQRSGNYLTQEPGTNGVPDASQPGAASSRLTEDDEPRYVGDVQLVFDGERPTSPEAGRVPVYDVGRNVNSYLSHESPALTPEMIDLVRQLGFDVRHELQY